MEITTKRTIAKNTFWLFTGQIIGRGLRAAIIVYSARILGAASWGAFSYALSFAAFLTIFSDIGVNALITREASKNPELRYKYFSTAFFIKLALLTLLAGTVLLFKNNLSSIDEAVALMPIIIFGFIFDSLRDLCSSISRAMEKMEIEAGVNIFTNIVIAGLGLYFLVYSPTSRNLAIAYAVGAGMGLMVIAITIRKYFLGLLSNFDKNLVRPILVSAWPFGLLGLMGTVMINTDTIMLGWMASAEAVGFYSAGQKIIQLLYVAPTLIAAAFFPALTRFAKNKEDSFQKLFEQALSIIYFIALPLTLGGIIMAKQIIYFLYGDVYGPATNSFIILLATIVIVFPTTLFANSIFAHNRQENLLPYVIIGISGNAIFNLLFIPVWGIEGAALSTLLNQIIISIYLWNRMQKISGFSIFSKLPKIIIATLGMGIITYSMTINDINFSISLFISAASYFIILALLKEPILIKIRKLL